MQESSCQDFKQMLLACVYGRLSIHVINSPGMDREMMRLFSAGLTES